jgi:hypothetical protein
LPDAAAPDLVAIQEQHDVPAHAEAAAVVVELHPYLVPAAGQRPLRVGIKLP